MMGVMGVRECSYDTDFKEGGDLNLCLQILCPEVPAAVPYSF